MKSEENRKLQEVTQKMSKGPKSNTEITKQLKFKNPILLWSNVPGR